MHNIRKIAEDVIYVGASDRRLALFENVYPIERGVSYNSYVVLDESTVLLDTADHSVSREFLENVEAALGGRSLDWLIVNHMEPDHCSVIAEIVLRYPDVKIVGNQKTIQMIKQFFSFDVDSRAHIVKDGDTLTTGKHTFAFVFAPMVHWPEVMVTFDTSNGFLFSADAFGTFGALAGNIYADELDFEKECSGFQQLPDLFVRCLVAQQWNLAQHLLFSAHLRAESVADCVKAGRLFHLCPQLPQSKIHSHQRIQRKGHGQPVVAGDLAGISVHSRQYLLLQYWGRLHGLAPQALQGILRNAQHQSIAAGLGMATKGFFVRPQNALYAYAGTVPPVIQTDAAYDLPQFTEETAFESKGLFQRFPEEIQRKV